MRRSLLIFLLLLSAFRALAQVGEPTFSFLNLPYSTAASGVGGNSVSSQESDLNMVLHNPAILEGDFDRNASVSYLNYMADIQVGSAIYAWKQKDRGAWMAGVRYVDYGNMLWTSNEGVILGETGATDLALSMGYAMPLTDRLQAGIQVGWLYSALGEYVASGLYSDLGLYYLNTESLFSAGLVLKNMGVQTNAYDETYESLPWDIQLGFSKKLAHAPFRLTATVQSLSNLDIQYVDRTEQENVKQPTFVQKLFKHVNLGLELVPNDQFLVSFGCHFRRLNELGIEQRTPFGGFTLGMAIRMKTGRIGASYAKYHLSGNALQMSYSVDLSKIGL